jgi:uncharacterized protein (AIM24 family)
MGGPGISRYTIADFVAKTTQRDLGQGLFELERDRMLEVNLNGEIWTKTGSMIAYLGDVKFTREGILEQGLGALFKKAISGEGARLTKATGRGKVYLADGGKKVSILQLQNESIFVNGNDVLAFEMSLQSEIKMMKKVAAMVSGGLFNVRLSGTGMLAIGAPVRLLNARTASMSATQSVSPTIAIPFGALSVTPFFPPSASIVTAAVLPASTRAMNPLPSFCDGLPLMFETKYASRSAS